MDWTDGAPSKVVEPGAPKKLLGWVALERPPFEFMNFLFFNTDEWVKYLESVTDATIGSLVFIVDAGGAGNFLDLQSAHDDALVVAGSRIFIVSDLDLDATVNITKPDIEIGMAPGKRFHKGGSAPATNFTGIDINATADRVRLMHLAFGSAVGGEKFSGAGDVAFNMNVGADNIFMLNPVFITGNTTDFTDNGNTTYVSVGSQSGLPA